MRLSRRAFLTGAAAVATAAALPAVAAVAPKLVVDPAMFAEGGLIKPFPPYPGPFYFVHKTEWDFFERAGWNMDLFKLVRPIPTTGESIWAK